MSVTLAHRASIQPMRLEDVLCLEKTISLRPSIRHLLPIAYEELFFPRLPELLRDGCRPQQPWPGKRMYRPRPIAYSLKASSRLTLMPSISRQRQKRAVCPVSFQFSISPISPRYGLSFSAKRLTASWRYPPL